MCGRFLFSKIIDQMLTFRRDWNMWTDWVNLYELLGPITLREGTSGGLSWLLTSSSPYCLIFVQKNKKASRNVM